MSQAIVDDHYTHLDLEHIRLEESSSSESPALCLYDLLSNSLILHNTIPFLPPSGLLSLGAASKPIRRLLYETPGAFRHLDLTNVNIAQFDIDGLDRGGEVWRNVQLDETLTEDDFYSGPLRGVFSTLRHRNLLLDVNTLILDGLSVTATLCYEIINDPIYRVKLLSIRDCKNLNHGSLRGALQYACRRTRPDGAPRLKALYVFGSKEPPIQSSPETPTAEGASIGAGWNHRSHKALTSSLEREGELWWHRKGRTVSKHIHVGWGDCLLVCEGLIAFDAVLCQGPRHRNSLVYGRPSMSGHNDPCVATFAVGPCETCGKAPEGVTTYTDDRTNPLPTSLPLLAPPPIFSSSLRAATAPHQPAGSFVPRCSDCLRERYCASCHKWWCESCYVPPAAPGMVDMAGEGGESGAPGNTELDFSQVKPKTRISKSCWECGNNCVNCIDFTQRVCKKCCGGYCIIHNEGSSSIFGVSLAAVGLEDCDVRRTSAALGVSQSTKAADLDGLAA